MNDYIIITDSTGDFTPALCEELGIQVIPMEFMLDDVSYRNYPDERDLSGKEFYDKLRTGSNATTAQVNMATYCDVARPYLQAGKDVLFLVFSSGLSGSYNSCTLAVEDLKAEFADRQHGRRLACLLRGTAAKGWQNACRGCRLGNRKPRPSVPLVYCG